MLTFEYILILLTAIFLSNLIYRFIPSLSVPVIQIILGACISFLPWGADTEFEPRLFFVLFIAPLIFNAGMSIDKQSFWKLKGPILNMSFVLVLLTVIGIGYFTHLLIPVIPLAASFALIAALAPTDDVAIISVSQKVNIPKKLMDILSGESIINDASGIVSFQFAIAAVMTGTFSVVYATGQLLVIGLGGILLGLAFTFVKFLFMQWIRRLGMENVTLYNLIAILTPFLIYLLAEAWEVSGILAVFAAGIAHSLGRKQLTPETVNLKIAAKNTWSTLSFTLEGLVYLILGTQLPAILRTIESGSYSVSMEKIIAYILILTLIFALSRFVWSYCTIRHKTYFEPENPVSKIKAGLIFSFAGARGAVTMAGILSIPVLLSDGSDFPQRDLIILLATGVIICSLFITNFILPAVVSGGNKEEKETRENEACLAILHNVMTDLSTQMTEENRIATGIVLKQYRNRMESFHNKRTVRSSDKEAESAWRKKLFEWEKQHTQELAERGEIDNATAQHYLDILNKRADIELNRYNPLRQLIHIAERIKHAVKYHKMRRNEEKRTRDLFALKEKNALYVTDKLKAMLETDDSYELKKVLSDYGTTLLMLRNMNSLPGNGINRKMIDDQVTEIASLGFQLERDQIQEMFENGRLSREKAKELRNNITLSETEIKE